MLLTGAIGDVSPAYAGVEAEWRLRRPGQPCQPHVCGGGSSSGPRQPRVHGGRGCHGRHTSRPTASAPRMWGSRVDRDRDGGVLAVSPAHAGACTEMRLPLPGVRSAGADAHCTRVGCY